MMNKEFNVAHLIVNNLGGITTLTQNLVLYKGENSLKQKLFLLNVKGNKNTPASKFINSAIDLDYLNFDPRSNWYYSFSKIAKALSHQHGILVSNDQYDLIMLTAFNIPRKVAQLVHDSYNLELSCKFHHVIDVFIAHNASIFNELKDRLPLRTDDIYYQPYGIPVENDIPIIKRSSDILNLIYIGRHDKSKGIYDLFYINEGLKKRNIHVQWTILGQGPETEGLKKQWQKEANVSFLLASDSREVLTYAANHDIFVFPTQFEGSPVSMLEAMSVGCVPVVTDLPGGIAETIINGETGFKCNLAHTGEFVVAIEQLNTDRSLLAHMSLNCKNKVAGSFDIYKNTFEFQEIFKKYSYSQEFPRHHSVNEKIGSRLDMRYLPSLIVYIVRLIKIVFRNLRKKYEFYSSKN